MKAGVQHAASTALQQLGARLTPATVDSLTRMLQGPDRRTAIYAARALSGLEENMPPEAEEVLAAALRSGEYTLWAAEALLRKGHGANLLAQDFLVDGLLDKSPGRRYHPGQFLDVLAGFATHLSDVTVTRLADDLLSHADQSVRERAAIVLSYALPAAIATVQDQLLVALQDGEPDVERPASLAFARLGSELCKPDVKAKIISLIRERGDAMYWARRAAMGLGSDALLEVQECLMEDLIEGFSIDSLSQEALMAIGKVAPSLERENDKQVKSYDKFLKSIRDAWLTGKLGDRLELLDLMSDGRLVYRSEIFDTPSYSNSEFQHRRQSVAQFFWDRASFARLLRRGLIHTMMGIEDRAWALRFLPGELARNYGINSGLGRLSFSPVGSSASPPGPPYESQDEEVFSE